MKWHCILALLLLTGIWSACSTAKQRLFASKTPHESYQAQLKNAGLQHTRLATAWTQAATQSLLRPVTISLPYQETGYFQDAVPYAAGFAFTARQGEVIEAILSTNPANGAIVFIDLLMAEAGNNKHLANSDTISKIIKFEVQQSGRYTLRLQPELLKSIAYTITISTKPSLAFPVSEQYQPRVMSIWGDSRDNNARKHEGIDIFAKKGTPAIAIADGYVTSVREGGLGGKVVFMRPDRRNIQLYYAHLDSQLVATGETVKRGDVIGLIGNTGNARNTPAHLHFGIYSSGGAVDPLPYVKDARQAIPVLSADTALISRHVGANIKKEKKKNSNRLTPVKILAATGERYRVQLPDSLETIVAKNTLTLTPTRKQNAKATPVYEQANVQAPIITTIAPGNAVNIIGTHEAFDFITDGTLAGWMLR